VEKYRKKNVDGRNIEKKNVREEEY